LSSDGLPALEWRAVPIRSVLALGFALAAASAAHAHPLAPSLLELREAGGGRVEVAWKTPLFVPRGAASEPVLPARCRPLGPRTVAAEETGIRTQWTVDCGAEGLTGAEIGVTGLDVPAGAALVRVTLADGRVVQGILSARRTSLVIPPHPRLADVVRDYAALGVAHILTGWDHLLFVFGLVLLARTPRRLLGTVSAFTLGHSVTLTLAVLDLIVVPPAPIEAAIALSILVLAIELAREPEHPTFIRRRPWAMAGTFGLLHGLGFAAVLREAGLPSGDIPLALVSFNAGIEAGQLAFVLALLAVGAVALRLTGPLPSWARRVPVYGMGSLAAFWWIERSAALLR
jgi:hydrogenase/urease accessory protein HupE